MTFVLVPGAGGNAWDWHLVGERLRAHGHEVIGVDLPAADETAGLTRYAQVIAEAAAGARDVVLVAHSMGGLSAPLACDRLPVSALILVNAMIPAPGETGHQWGVATGHGAAVPELSDDFDEDEFFYHDVPPHLAAQARANGRPETSTAFDEPWPLGAWPDVPTRVIAGAADRFFPPDFQARVARDRLGLATETVPGGHFVALSRPDELTARLLA
ncbi:alpha/beta hydrolase [Actinoplanes sp. NPDC024001]|uniref:alpha/beta fold hydrolase n=1 Tax=Actinoplanes sp. NPDC024001 TaxID=3154598 RepID=UPI0033FD2D64